MLHEALKNRLGAPPLKEAPKITNLSKPPAGKEKRCCFIIPSELHTEYKIYAASKGKSMTDIFVEAFKLYKSQNM